MPEMWSRFLTNSLGQGMNSTIVPTMGYPSDSIVLPLESKQTIHLRETIVDTPQRVGYLPLENKILLGRDDECHDVIHRWQAGSRLITILGPGGVGKTSLMKRLGHRISEKNMVPTGVWFCDLTETTTVEGVCHTIGNLLVYTTK